MSAKINVGGVETFSTVDFPEHMAAVVFLQGCPWRCPFCHNTSLQPIDSATDFVWEKFLDFLEKLLDNGYKDMTLNYIENVMPHFWANDRFIKLQEKLMGFKSEIKT